MTNEQRNGVYPYCPHGKCMGSSLLPAGGWNGGVSRCSCCFSDFGYIDHGSLSGTGGTSKSWQPKNLCGGCGGKYVEHAWGDALPALTETP